VDCETILDLADTGVLAAQGAAPMKLARLWKDPSARGTKPPTWMLAEGLITNGTAGIIVPSFAAGAGAADINVEFWDWVPLVSDAHGRSKSGHDTIGTANRHRPVRPVPEQVYVTHPPIGNFKPKTALIRSQTLK
jgi:hypothetical protein